MPAKLKNGVIGASGGKREGAGRKPDWLKQKCQEAGNKVIDFLISVATGEDQEQVVTDDGQTIRVPAAVKDRIKASEIILERGFGRPLQTIDPTGLDSLNIGALALLVVQQRQERGLVDE